MFNEHNGGACAIAIPTTSTKTTMQAYQLSQQRLKCGEVFVWDCVGELFAIECLLCEERPLCTLSEFAEHMDIWHYDWTAEAHASLPDTTTQECCEILPTQWAALWGHTDSTSDSNEVEADNFDTAADSVLEMKEQLEVATEIGTQHATTVCGSSESAFDDTIRSLVPFEALLISMENASSDLCATAVDSSFCAEESRWSGIAERPASNVQTSSLNAGAKKRVKDPALQRLKTEKLIEIYEKFPELWHKQQRNNGKSDSEAKAYRSISLELKQLGINLKPPAVQRRLGALRKRYRLEKLAELKSYVEERPYSSSFEFYAQLRFLREHIEPQLCGICKRICKDATECCKSTEELVAQGEECINNRESGANGAVACAAVEQVRGNEADTKVEQVDDEKPIPEDVTSAGTVPAVTTEKEVVTQLDSTNASDLGRFGNVSNDEASTTTGNTAVQPTNEPQKQQNTDIEAVVITAPTQSSRNRKNAARAPKTEKRILRKRNKVEILEVIELQPAFNFKTQEPEVSTSTLEHNQAEILHENTSTSRFDVATMVDENMTSEEDDASNGDSGILRDFDEQIDAEGNNDAANDETESFARLTTEQVHKLIQLYEQYPILWDPDHADFSTRERRRNAWRQMTAQLNAQFQMRYTWPTVHRKVHDYVKYYRRERQRIDSEGGCTKWCFYDDFAFMSQVVAEHGIDAPKLLLNKQQNRKIIEVYAEYPELWNINHAQFKRRRLRQGLFKSMSDKLRDAHNIKISPLKLKQRIVEFRCTYRLEKERCFAIEQQGDTYKPCYEYYKLLSFLDPHVAPFICTKCGVQYKKYTEIERHMRKEHTKKIRLQNLGTTSDPQTDRERKAAALDNVCHICGMSFTLPRNLKCHIKRHSEQRTHACQSCPKKFFDGATLRVHERSHTKYRPFICDQCGASYVSGSKLNQHIKRHSNQRDHPCEVCGKAFYSAFECDRHMRTHMNIREKVCTICGKDFSVGSSYYAHMLLHTGEKKYKCKMCYKQFAQFAGLYKHRRRHHPTEFAKEKAKKDGAFVEEEGKKEECA